MILAIDPGSEKTGTAVLRNDGSLVCRQIIPTEDTARTTAIFSPLPKSGYKRKRPM